MNLKVYMVDAKDREFEIDIKYYPGTSHVYRSDNVLPGDAPGFDVLKAKHTIEVGKRKRTVELDESELYQYIDEDDLAVKIIDEVGDSVSWEM